MTPEFTVVDDPSDCIALRMAVFVDEQGIAVDEELDNLDDEATHILVRDNGTPVGTARLLYHGDTAKIGRVCVAKSARGTGLGVTLMQFAIELIGKTPTTRRIQLSAQTYAIGFYGRLGFAAFGPIYDDAGIPHRDMVKEIR